MRKRRSHPVGLTLLLVASCFGVAAQGKCASASAHKEATTVTDKDNGGKINLAKDALLIIKLETRSGTGYNWEIVKYDSSKLMLLGEPTVESPEEVPGAVERQVFQFKAQAVGTTVIELRYVRPWEKDAEPLKVYKLEVQIR